MNEHRNLVVVRSLCEPFANARHPHQLLHRAHPDTIAQITRFYDSSCVPMFAEVIGELALTETGAPRAHARVPLTSRSPWLQCVLNLIPGIDIFPAGRTTSCARSTPAPTWRSVANTDELAQAPATGRVPDPQAGGNSRAEDSRYFCVAVRARGQREAGGGPARDRLGC